MQQASDIAFRVNGRLVTVARDAARMTLLDWLRTEAGLKGTKEGCAEGDCGACTVILEDVSVDGSRESRAVTSCILLLGQVEGLNIHTVEEAPAANPVLAALQQSFADGGGTQCGFCTPGLVMSAQALLIANPDPTTAEIHDAIAGNLCRCTGYRPIVDAIAKAALSLKERPRTAVVTPDRQGNNQPARAADRDCSFAVPTDLATALKLKQAKPNAVLYAGGTDLGLLAGRDRAAPETIISLAKVRELQGVDAGPGCLRIGASVSYSDAIPSMLKQWPELQAYLTRIGSTQIRNAGTIGGNLGTASPIGDMAPVLLILDAEIDVAGPEGTRSIAVADFFAGYRRNALLAGEIIVAIRIANRKAETHVFADKLSRRRDQDISALTAAFSIGFDGDAVSSARIAFGGMADRPVRLREAEALLIGKHWSKAALLDVAHTAVSSLTPRDDLRASAHYRTEAATNLFERLYWRIAEPAAQVELDGLANV